MSNSSTSLASIVQFAKSHPEIAPVIQMAAGGSALEPALTIANDVMTDMVSQNFNFKWNRFMVPLLYTNTFQQDYCTNVVSLGWLEQAVLLDVNNTSMPQPKWPLEVVKDLPETSTQWGMPGQVCWIQNSQMVYATWGAPNTPISGSGNNFWPNPQPNSAIISPLGVNAMPNNPLLQVVDSFGNLWTVTTFGTTGATNPFITNLNPVFPTPQNPNQIATTVTDGTVVWTAINSNGMGIRCNPLPPQNGIVYQFRIIAQWRPFAFSNGPFKSLSQTIEPIPDDFAKYFRDGFVARTYLHSPDKGTRGKFQDMYNIWKESLLQEARQGDRERSNEGFYPAQSILSNPNAIYPGPAFPWPIGY